MDIKVTRIGDSYGVFVDGNLFQPPGEEKEARRLAEFLRRADAGEDVRPLITPGLKRLEDA